MFFRTSFYLGNSTAGYIRISPFFFSESLAWVDEPSSECTYSLPYLARSFGSWIYRTLSLSLSLSLSLPQT